MKNYSFAEIRLIIAKSTACNNLSISYLKSGGVKQKYFSHRISLIKTLKTYIKKYCQNSNKYNVLYLSILYLDIILSKNKISLSHDKNLKYLCLCCFLISLKLIGNFDTSKKIISNFCKNYKQEYKIFESQCLRLLDYNLVYTTTYDYLNMILIKEPKKLLSVCTSLLYQICEDNIYTYYSPFYISVAIFQIAKNSIKDNSHNHYDKYFQDERVKFLIKKFNHGINPPPIKEPLNKEKIIIKDDINFLNNTINVNHSNLNIFSNNSVKKNIFIVNTISSKKNDNNLKKHNSFFTNNKSTSIKYNIKENFNKNNIKISKNFLNNSIIDKKFITETSISERKNYEQFNNKIYSSSKNSNILFKPHFKLLSNNHHNDESDDKYNNHKTITIKQTNFKRPNCKIASYINNSNYLSNKSLPINNIVKKSFELKRHLYNKEESLSTDIQTPNQINNHNHRKKRIIYTNKSSLNFQLVSGVSKEKLVKLSRNLSKNIVKGKSMSPININENK